MILVTGATGKVGRHLVAGLLAEGAPVRALTRNPAAADLPAGADVARLDPGRPETIAAALAGTTAVFINATAVGALIADLMSEAARAGTRTAVLLSSFAVRDNGEQPYAIGTQHKALEDVVAASGLDWAFLRCGGFAANTLSWAPMIRAEGIVRAPYLNAATAPIAEEDVGAAAVRVLLGDGHGHAGARYVLTGQESITQAEQAKAIGAAIGRTLRTEELPPEVFRQAASAHLPAAAVDDLLRYWAEYAGRTAEVSQDLEKVAGRPAMTFAEWATRHVASLPIARSAMLADRTIADLGRAIVVLLAGLGAGLLVGFRFHNGFLPGLDGLALVLAFSYAMSWATAWIALKVKDPETAQVAGFLPFVPLIFASSGFVPVATMPGWLQGFANVQPFSVIISAVRALMQGGPTAHSLWQSLAWIAGILIVFGSLAVNEYRKA